MSNQHTRPTDKDSKNKDLPLDLLPVQQCARGGCSWDPELSVGRGDRGIAGGRGGGRQEVASELSPGDPVQIAE